MARQITERVGTTEGKVSIGNFNVKARNIEYILPKIWRAHNFVNFCKMSTPTLQLKGDRKLQVYVQENLCFAITLLGGHLFTANNRAIKSLKRQLNQEYTAKEIDLPLKVSPLINLYIITIFWKG